MILQCLALHSVLALIFFFSDPTSAFSTSSQAPLHDLNLSLPFNSTISSFMHARSIPALSLAITKNDRLVYATAYGHASNSTPVTPSNRFRLASVSKSITAISIMHLLQLGHLTLSSPVFGAHGILGTKYGHKPYAEDECKITVQHLLEHTSGFVNDDMCGTGCDPTYLAKWLHLDQWDLIGAILDQYDPSHTPGTVASYSNFGYFVLGRIVEEISGIMPYEKYVREEILGPLLGITSMQTGTDERQDLEVVYYDDDDPKAPYSFHVSRRDSVGAWIATPTDLVKILTAVDGLEKRDNILNETTRALMFERTSVEGSSFAKGWTVEVRDDGSLVEADKDGDYWGTNAYVSLKFETGVTWAVAVNKEIPNEGDFHGARDLKTLMDGIVDGIDEWPEEDLFDEEDE
jgi:D-alanyl-D-alanine carboxypeptidase